jgi:outer membrane protein assembly factor BamB
LKRKPTPGSRFSSHFALCAASTLLFSGVASAQGAPRGFWPVADASAAHAHWQKAETDITTETVANNFKLLWKIKLGNQASNSSTFSEPILVPGMITGKGFKDFAFWADANTVYAVDSELGALVWQKDFKFDSKTCGANIQIATEAPQVIHFGARKPAVPGARPAPPPSEDPVPASERRIGASAGGGYFGLKGVYIVTGDGSLHEQIMATGLDYAPPVKFLSPGADGLFGLNMNEKVVYATSASGCHGAANALSAIDLNTPDYKVSTYKTQKVSLAGLSGPAIGSDGTVYVTTGSGPADATAGVYPDSVVALASDGLKAKDWYTPSTPGKMLAASPVAFPYKEKELIVAPGQDGSLVLLDSKSLGGADHHTSLAQSGKISSAKKHGEWESLSTWLDKSGTSWILASISGPLDPATKFDSSNGAASHGSIVAFKVEEKDGHTVLTPAWSSQDLVNPAPPVIANGVVFALESGTSSSHAKLFALDAATGKQLFTSGDAIATYAHNAGMSVGDGHVFFTTHDNTLYSFGIPLEH